MGSWPPSRPQALGRASGGLRGPLRRAGRAVVPVQECPCSGRGGGTEGGELCRRRWAAQQAVADHWLQLSDLIGSASGAKLRTFAQSLTLERLLLEANAQLGELSPRYRLERVPGTDLALQVVDLDMGDEVRSVDSLSGGESFLVSLALALALSQPILPSDPGRIAVHRRGVRHPGSGQPGSGALQPGLPAGGGPPDRGHLPRSDPGVSGSACRSGSRPSAVARAGWCCPDGDVSAMAKGPCQRGLFVGVFKTCAYFRSGNILVSVLSLSTWW